MMRMVDDRDRLLPGAPLRVGWDSVDLRHKGVTIEVKSSAYLQAWGQKRLSRIQFGALVKGHGIMSVE